MQELNWGVDEVMDFYSSLSGVNSFMKKNPESTLIEDLRKDLKKVLGEKQNDKFVLMDRFYLVLMKKS